MEDFFFAGPIFSETEWRLMMLAAFIVSCLALATIVYVVNTLLIKRKTISSKFSFKKSFLVSLSITGGIALAFIVAPTIIEDRDWDNKQAECARKAGYSSPADNESSKATARSQYVYRTCINTTRTN